MRYQPRIPETPPLADCIEVMFCLDDYDPEHRVERLVPDGRLTLVIELDGQRRHVLDNESLNPVQDCVGAWVSGVHTRFISITALPGTRLAAVHFKPGKGLALIHDSLDRLNNRVIPAWDVFGPSILELRDELAAIDDTNTVLDRLEAWLANRFNPDLGAHPEVDRAVASIMANPSVATLDEVLENSGVSRKHLIRLFKRHVGPTPKQLQTVLRFGQALARIQADEDARWAEVANDCGYSDQSHFIRDFFRFSGYRPREFGDEGHDRSNFFPADRT